jgi:hypothetical protein
MGTSCRRASFVVAPLQVALAVSLVACSSSKSTADSGSPFGPDDTGSSAKKDAKPRDTGTTKMTGVDAGGQYDGACGSNGESSWCVENSPTSTSMPMCDDFDSAELNNLYGWVGVTPASLVNTHYVSPFCALSVRVFGDGGGIPFQQHGPFQGSFTEHSYTAAPGTGPSTSEFDLYLPNQPACEGAVIGRFSASGVAASAGDAAMAWLSVTGLQGSGATPSSYTLNLTVGVGQTGDGGLPTPSSPVTVVVTPQGSDGGWARVGIDVSSYTIGTAGAITAQPIWGYRGSTTVKGMSSTSATATGTLKELSMNGLVRVDVGLPPGPTGVSVAGCQLWVDDFLSQL